MANSADSDQLAYLKPTDLDLHCLQRQGISGLSRKRVNLPDVYKLFPLKALLKTVMLKITQFLNPQGMNVESFDDDRNKIEVTTGPHIVLLDI